MFPWEILYENVFKALLLELQGCPEKVLLTSCLEGIVLTASIRRDRVRERGWGGIECWGSQNLVWELSFNSIIIMVPLPATLPRGTLAEIPSFLLCLQSKCLVCQSERGVAVQLHKVDEGSGGLTVSQKGLSNNPAVFIITFTPSSSRDTWFTKSWVFGELCCIYQVASQPLLLLG